MPNTVTQNKMLMLDQKAWCLEFRKHFIVQWNAYS